MKFHVETLSMCGSQYLPCRQLTKKTNQCGHVSSLPVVEVPGVVVLRLRILWLPLPLDETLVSLLDLQHPRQHVLHLCGQPMHTHLLA